MALSSHDLLGFIMCLSPNALSRYSLLGIRNMIVLSNSLICVWAASMKVLLKCMKILLKWCPRFQLNKKYLRCLLISKCIVTAKSEYFHSICALILDYRLRGPSMLRIVVNFHFYMI